MKRQEHKGINAKIMQIMSLALEISPADVPENNGNPHVFVDYSPHCNQLSLRVYCNGWEKEKEPDYREVFYGDRENACEKADEIIAYLENLKSDRTDGECNLIFGECDLIVSVAKD